MDADLGPPQPPEAAGPPPADGIAAPSEPGEPEAVVTAPGPDDPGGQIELPLEVEPAVQTIPEPEPRGPNEADPRTTLIRLIVFAAVAVITVATLVTLALWRPPESEPEREIRA